MACAAARKQTKAALREICLHSSDRGIAPLEVWMKVKWWTPQTIEEALDELTFEKAGVVCHRGPFGKHYRAVDCDPAIRYNAQMPTPPEG